MSVVERKNLIELLQERPGLNDCFYVVAVEAAVYHRGRYLIIQRAANETHAPGLLGFPGGKVQGEFDAQGILETTAAREVLEETGIRIDERMTYMGSSVFVGDDGKPMISVLFLCRHKSGDPCAADLEEVSSAAWMTPEEVMAHPAAPSWLKTSLMQVETHRRQCGY